MLISMLKSWNCFGCSLETSVNNLYFLFCFINEGKGEMYILSLYWEYMDLREGEFLEYGLYDQNLLDKSDVMYLPQLMPSFYVILQQPCSGDWGGKAAIICCEPFPFCRSPMQTIASINWLLLILPFLLQLHTALTFSVSYWP